MEQKMFSVSGTFREGKLMQKFSKEVLGHNEAYAKEKTFSLFGSKHHVPRSSIKIEKVELAKPKKMTGVNGRILESIGV